MVHGGLLFWTRKKDEYDINENGQVNDDSGVNPSTVSFKVIPQNEFLQLKIQLIFNDGSESGKVDILNKDDLNYKLSLKFNDNVNFSRFCLLCTDY